jgi:hypothetical protein
MKEHVFSHKISFSYQFLVVMCLNDLIIFWLNGWRMLVKSGKIVTENDNFFTHFPI